MIETVEVSAILKDIFAEEEASVPEVVIDVKSEKEIMPGMDTESTVFASRLIEKASWTRSELEQLASEMNILLDGTLETINDASFEAFGQAFFEGEDPIEINKQVLEEINK
jgi:hypothetical protein